MSDPVSEREAALVAALAADARPVRPLRPPHERLAVWLVVATALIGLYGGLSPRPDLRLHLRQAGFVAELALLFALATWTAWLAVRGAFPDRVPAPGEHRAGLGMLALGMLTLLARRPEWDVTLGSFFAAGVPCFGTTVGLALAPVLVLLVAAARGAPLAPRWTAALSGGAGVLVAYVAMRLHCPLDGRLHLLVWHALPIGAGAAACAALGTWWLGRWHWTPRTSVLRLSPSRTDCTDVT